MAAVVRIENGDIVAVSLPPGEPWLDLVAAVWHAGAVLFPIDHRLPQASVAELWRQSGATVIVDDRGHRRTGTPTGPLDVGHLDVGHPDADYPDADHCRPSHPHPGLLMTTSGTSGRPRLVQIGRGAVTAAVGASAQALGGGNGEGWVSQLPLAHIGGLLVVLRGILGGTLVGFQPPSDPATPSPGLRFTAMVPTTLSRALDRGVDLTGYRAILLGGAATPPDLLARARQAGISCVPTYGMTESCGGVVYEGVPLAGVAMRIGGGGEIHLGGPTLMSGYLNDPASTAASRTDDGWLRTRDVGRIDEAGRLQVIGRLDDMIVSGAENVWPTDVEEALRDHPDVFDVAVVGRDDPRWGQRVVAVVVPRNPGGPPTLASLRDVAAAALGRHRAPRELVVVTELPRAALGKVARAELLALVGGPGSMVWDDRSR